jgi:hypothetical protein
MNACKETVSRSSSPRSRSTFGAPVWPASHRLAQRFGNQTLQRLLRQHVLQTKLTVSHPGDIFEQEAERVADDVMRMTEPAESGPAESGLEHGGKRDTPRIQRMCPDCEELQREAAPGQDHAGHAIADAAGACVVFRASHPTDWSGLDVPAPPTVADVIDSPGEPLDPATRAFFEPRFGHDFGHVRVHTDAKAGASASALHAQAYTVGAHIAFGAGRYAPGHPGSRRLLAHELTHVVQQSSGAQRVQRQIAGCQDILMEPGAASVVSGRIVHQILAAHFRATVDGATSVAIPGGSAGPLRSDPICGGSSKIIGPQIVGGASGAGLPDLARRTLGGILQVAEIKPATVPCLVDGEEQELRYIDQGNARDPVQSAWRSSLGISVVSPMPPSAYSPPVLYMVLPSGATAELKTAWCTPGLMAYSVTLSGKPVAVPVPQARRAEASQRLRTEAADRGVAVGAGVAIGVATAVAGRALWKHFWRVVVTRFALRAAIAAGLAVADGPLPIGDLIALGMTLATIAQIIADWDDIWREADHLV